MATSFKKGDVVMLKSGGPQMTVEEISDDLGVRCTWFDGNHRFDDWFAHELLKVPPKASFRAVRVGRA